MTEIRESSIEEQIAKWLYLDRFQNPKTAPAWENMPLFAKRTWEDKAKAILAIPEIKEGLELLEKAGSGKLVELANTQVKPALRADQLSSDDYRRGYKHGQYEMESAGFRRVR